MTTLRIDCHRHMGGSISPEFVWRAIQRTRAAHLAESFADVRAAMTFAHEEPHNFHRFLDKFKILDEIEWTDSLLDESISDVVDGINEDRLDFCWLRFSVNKYLPYLKWHRHELIKFIHDRFEYRAPNRVGLVLSLKYESTKPSQRQVAQLIEHPDVADSCLGIDLVGDEQYFAADFYGPLLAPWKKAGKVVMAHVSEFGPAENTVAAMKIGITDICHGLWYVESPHYKPSDLRADDVCFHMAITPNFLTGVWDDGAYHPIVQLLEDRVQVTLGTDDPIQCGNTYDSEFDRVSRMVKPQQLQQLREHAASRTLKYRKLP